MKHLNISVVLLLAITVFLCECKRHDAISKQLEQAAALMDSRPDSALAVLDSLTLSYPIIRSDKDRALYGMLYTQALDKNHLDPKNDSLISFAVDYYNRKKDVSRQIVSTYYRGRVLFHKGLLSQALVNFYKAKELAENDSSFFWAGMACRGIADIYNDTYNSAEQLIYATKEYEYIKKSGKQPYLNYALHDLGTAFNNNGKTDEVLKITKNLIDSAILTNDDYLYYATLQLKAWSLIRIDKYDEARPVITEVCENKFATSEDSINLCLVLLNTGFEKEGAKLIEALSNYNAPLKNLAIYTLYKKTGQAAAALSEGQIIYRETNKMFETAMSQELTTSLADYFELNKKINNAELRASRLTTLLIIILSLLILSGVGYTALYIYKSQKHEIADKILFAEQLQEALKQSKNENSTSFQIIKTLLGSKYKLFEELSEIVIRYTDTKVARRKIADRVTELISSLSIEGDKIKELENQVNEFYNNLYYDFKNDLPGLKEADYLLYLFSVLGFSNTSISLLLKEDKIEAVYNRKRRLKDKIKQLDTTKRDRYMSYLS